MAHQFNVGDRVTYMTESGPRGTATVTRGNYPCTQAGFEDRELVDIESDIFVVKCSYPIDAERLSLIRRDYVYETRMFFDGRRVCVGDIVMVGFGMGGRPDPAIVEDVWDTSFFAARKPDGGVFTCRPDKFESKHTHETICSLASDGWAWRPNAST